jgi:hypothetical protein
VKKHKMDCGCEFDIIDEKINPVTNLPSISIDYYNLRLDCEKTWECFKNSTKGVFQLETQLGQTWSRKLKPECIEDLAALTAVLRPGVLKAKLDDKSLTQHFVDRKNKISEVEEIDPSITDILKDTQQILVYQEETLQIAQKIAGFDLKQADILRRAIGKKIPELMTKVEVEFIEGVKKTGIVTEEKGKEIWDMIRKSERYSFNKCVSYDTKIRRPFKGGYDIVLSIEEMYKIRNDINYAKNTGHLSLYKKWKLNKNFGKGLSICSDGRIRPNTILDIQPAGKRLVFRITTENEYYIETTSNHKFPTPEGEKILAQLKVGDKLYTCGEYEKSDFNKINKFSNWTIEDLRKERRNHSGKKGFDNGENNPRFTNGAYSEYARNIKKLTNYCELCGATQTRLEVHHIDKDRTNNQPTNLVRLCSSCHKKEEYRTGRTKQGEKGYPSFLDKIISIEVVNVKKDTYDVTMDGPNHNFVTSKGIVTSNSHSVSYALLGYWAAYLKSHFPILFYTSWLSFAKYKLDGKSEIKELIRDAKHQDIKVNNPSITCLFSDFTIHNGEIFFGISNVKGIGEAQFNKLIKTVNDLEVKYKKKVKDYRWVEYLLILFPKLTKTIITNLILVGGFDHLKYTRKQMLYEYNISSQLTDKEINQLLCCSVEDPLSKRMYGIKVNKNRQKIIDSLIESLEKPKISFEDNLVWLNKTEEDLLGIPLSVSKLDTCDIIDANTTCKEFKDGKSGSVILSVEIVQSKEITTKRGENSGQKMGFLEVEDETGSLDNIAVFSNTWQEYKNVLYKGNTILLYGYKSKKDSLILQKALQI